MATTQMSSLASIDISGALTNAQAQQQKSLLGNTQSNVPEAEKQKMLAKAKEFESFYLYQVLELMTPKTESEFDGGVGEEMFRHNLNEQMAKNISNAGGMGIADAVYGELVKHQEALAAARNAAASAYTSSAQ